MLPFFPFEEEFDPGMGMRLLKDNEPLCHIDPARYSQEIALKEHLLCQDHPYYFLGGADTLPAQWDVVELVAANLARVYPQHFRWRAEGAVRSWENLLMGTRATLTMDNLEGWPCEPLDWIGRQIQDDLVLLSADSANTFVGGQLCFANGWDIKDRLGKSFSEIHRRTPQSTMASVHTGARFLEMLRPGRTYWRMSWNFKLTDQLDMTTRHKAAYKADFSKRAPKLTLKDVGEAVFIRIERQTFTRLHPSGTLLFGIHTYNSSVAEEATDPDRARRLYQVLRGTPREVMDYKAITPIEKPLMGFLETCCAAK